MRTVAVIGPGDGASAAECATAFEVGRMLAERGVVVLTGGLGGVMAAAARGAAAGGGQSIGLLPDRDATRRDGSTAPHPAAAEGDPAHSILVRTGLGELRNGLLVHAADAVIAIGGSWGTLSELALAMRTGVPVVSIHGWTVTDGAGARIAVPTAPDAATAIATVARPNP